LQSPQEPAFVAPESAAALLERGEQPLEHGQGLLDLESGHNHGALLFALINAKIEAMVPIHGRLLPPLPGPPDNMAKRRNSEKLIR
jgi:hypothetical protein